MSKGEKIITQGSVGTTFYLIKVGGVDVITRPADGSAAKLLTSLKGGDYFGEQSLLFDKETSADIVSTEPTELMCLPKTLF